MATFEHTPKGLVCRCSVETITFSSRNPSPQQVGMFIELLKIYGYSGSFRLSIWMHRTYGWETCRNLPSIPFLSHTQSTSQVGGDLQDVYVHIMTNNRNK